MRPKVRISDVVRISGVSRATVDRVLNNRAGVLEATRSQVVRALKQLGYAPDALSALENRKPHDIRVFLLDGTNPFFAEIREGFLRAIGALHPLGIRTKVVSFDPYQPHTLAEVLSRPDTMTAAIVAVGAQTPEIAAAIDALQNKGVPVITVISDIRNSTRAAHVGQDNKAAGRVAARLMANMVPPGPGKIGLLTGHADFQHLTDRRRGFVETLARMRPELETVRTRPYGGADADSSQVVEELFTRVSDLAGVYLSGGGQPHLIRALSRHRSDAQVIIAHELTPISRVALEDGTFQALVSHDMGHVARLAFDEAIVRTDRPDMAKLAGEPLACGINIYLPENLPALRERISARRTRDTVSTYNGHGLNKKNHLTGTSREVSTSR
jgi:LacI family transcriptional regulator